MEKFLKENKIVLLIWMFWMMVNLSMWKSSAYWSGNSKGEFWLFSDNNYNYSMSEMWDLPEVFVYGVGSLILYFIAKFIKIDEFIKELFNQIFGE